MIAREQIRLAAQEAAESVREAMEKFYEATRCHAKCSAEWHQGAARFNEAGERVLSGPRLHVSVDVVGITGTAFSRRQPPEIEREIG